MGHAGCRREGQTFEAPASLNRPSILREKVVYQTWHSLLRFAGVSLRLRASASEMSPRRSRALQLTFLGSGVTSRAHSLLQFRERTLPRWRNW
jgi:hypothetical protein